MILRATAVQTRKALEIVEAFKQAGIRFLPMPIVDDEDEIRVAQDIDRKLDMMEEISR